MDVLGIEIGSSKIKGAIVDVHKGELLTKITSLEPDQNLEPHKLVSAIHKLSKKMDWKGPIGCTFPAPIRKGVVLRTDKIHESWEDVDAEHLFSEITNGSVKVVNYSDAVGIAEMKFGSGNGKNGTVLVLTIEDNIGSSLFFNGELIPNMELGQIELRGVSVQDRASSKVRKEEGISSKQWAARIHYILENYERIFHPELFIIGGKASKKANKIFPYINVNTKVKSTTFLNEAGIVGAATFAYQSLQATRPKAQKKAAGQ